MTETAAEPMETARDERAPGRGGLSFAPETPVGWLAGMALLGAIAGGVGGAVLHSVLAAGVMAVVFAVLAAVSTVDVYERRIPNALMYPGTLLALLLAAPMGLDALAQAGGGLLLAGGVMAVFWFIGGGKLGLGDVKLSAFAGAVLGAGGVALYLVVGVTAGAVGALALLLAGRGRQATMPYGPYLALGAAVALLLEGPVIG